MSFDKYTHVCNYYYNQGIEQFITSKSSLVSLFKSFLSPALSLFPYNYSPGFVTMNVLLVLEFHIKRIIHYPLFLA